MLSTGTPFADSTDTNVCRISRGTQSSPRPAFFVMILNALITLFAVKAVPTLDANSSPVFCHTSPARARSLFCCAQSFLSASTHRCGKASVRRDFCVFVSPPARSDRHT